MLQTQRQGTVNLGTARAGLVLAAAIAAAAVVGQLIAQVPVSFSAPDVVGVPSTSTWQSDAGTRREGSTAVAPAVQPASNASSSLSESSLYERLAGASATNGQTTQPHNSGGGAHKGGLIPQ